MRRAGAAVAAGLLLAACGSSGPSTPQTIAVRSAAFAPGGTVPRLYTCDGRDISLPLQWSGVPDGATELELTMNDRDAPGGNFIHWQMSGLSPKSTGLAAGELPTIGQVGTNSYGTTGYRGPCPPRGEKPHHYVITISALGGGTEVGSGTLTGIYWR